MLISVWKYSDDGDFAYWNGHWYKSRGGQTIYIDDSPIADYPTSPFYVPPVPNGAWHPRPPSKDLCKQYCDCNARSSQATSMNDQCDCVSKCTGGK